MKSYEDTVKHFEEWQKKIIEKVNDVEAEKAKYKAEFKATFGICDGDPMNVLEVVKAIRAVNSLT